MPSTGAKAHLKQRSYSSPHKHKAQARIANAQNRSKSSPHKHKAQVEMPVKGKQCPPRTQCTVLYKQQPRYYTI